MQAISSGRPVGARGPAPRWLAVLAGLAVVMAACGKSSSTSTRSTGSTAGASAASLSISSPGDGIQMKGNVVPLALHVSGISITKANGDTSGSTGHFHVFIDREPPAPGSVIAKEPGIIHSADNPIILTGLAVGRHRLVVVLGDGSHRRLGSSQAAITVDIVGPSVKAKAPATVPAGQPAVVNVEVQGVRLVPAKGDTTGTTGHLHFFVDRPPTAPGQPIPKEPGIIHTTETTVSIPDLAPGEHTVYVVLGDGTHTPFNPPVEDKVTFTVAAAA